MSAVLLATPPASGARRFWALPFASGLAGLLLTACLGLFAFGCRCDDDPAPKDGEAVKPGESPAGDLRLSAEERARVLAQVGDVKITLGDFAEVLTRMDRFERLRYQSPERRKLLLDELVKVELLAQEAERLGLEKDPEVRLGFRQALRDELRHTWLEELPTPGDLPLSEVQAYYAEHKEEFADPERRRLGHIELSSRAQAETVLAKALKASPEEWGELVKAHSLDRASINPSEPLELLGDIGIVSLTGEKGGGSSRAPQPVIQAGFELEKLGDVYPKLVESSGRFHIVRLMGKTEARARTFAESERTIRVLLVQQRILQKEQALKQELLKRYPVIVDQEQLEKLKIEHPNLAQAGGKKKAAE